MVLFVGVGVIIAGSAAYQAIRGVRKVARSAELRSAGRDEMATIVDNQLHSNRGSNHHSYMTFRPVLRYRISGDREVTAVGSKASRSSFIVGTSVPIRYNPNDPTHVEITSGHGAGNDGISSIIWGVVGAAIAIGMIIFATLAFGSNGGSSFDDPCSGVPDGVVCTNP